MPGSRSPVEPAAGGIEAHHARRRREPGLDRDEHQRQHQKSAEDAGDECPVEQLEGTDDPPAHQQHTHAGKERPDADPVHQRGVSRAGDPPLLVASNRALIETLEWQPRFADIETIIAHALGWERKLLDRS